MPVFKSKDAKLATRLSSDLVGIGDYVVKKDFRRSYDQDCRREGYDYFWPQTEGEFTTDPGGQPFPALVVSEDPTGEPITLVHMARRPNGKQAIIVGTKTRLWRFFGMEDGEYYEEPPAPDAPYFEEPTGDEAADELAGRPYFAVDENVQWMLIGSGFSPNGHRWEVLDINGWTVLNNGVDLPMTYRIEEVEVVPIYELREQGIACVGTIGEISGILMCGDISEIHEEQLHEMMRHSGDIDSGNMTVAKVGTKAVTAADFFTKNTLDMPGIDMTNRWIVWDTGQEWKIQTILNKREAEVVGGIGSPSVSIPSNFFTLRNKATQAGATFSELLVGTVTAGDATVTADGAIFNSGMAGKTIRFANGFSAIIATFTDTTHIEMNVPSPEAIPGLPFWITDVNLDPPTNNRLTSEADAFTEDMAPNPEINRPGRFIIFDNGETRQITKWLHARAVEVDSDASIGPEYFQINNPASYGAFTDAEAIDRIQYRTIWSMPEEPRRFAAIVLGSMEAGSQDVHLEFPTKSFASGQEIIIVGAGVDGGNLVTTILSVNGFGQSLFVADEAVTTVEGAVVEQADAFGSIVGFEDLQDDSSQILRIWNLGRVLVIYKDTCVFTATYTGNPDNPFDFVRLKMPPGVNLFYRWTLVDIGGLFHIFAGTNAFFRFDLSSRVPQVITELDHVSDIFFSQATLEKTDEIFGANNSVTNEIFFCFPSTSEHKAISYDYKYSTVATTGMEFTAGCTVRRPTVEVRLTEDLFVMGNKFGTILVYGKADAVQSSWRAVEGGPALKEIFYRRSAYPFNSAKGEYESLLVSGLGDLGNFQNVKNITNMVLSLGSQSPNCHVAYFLYGVRNASEPLTLLGQVFLTSPATQNLIPGFFQANYFQYKIRIFGKNNPCQVAGHSFLLQDVPSMDHERRP